MPRIWTGVTALLMGCGEDPATPSEDPIESGPYVVLDPVGHLNRAAITLVNRRPTEAELDAVVADPASIDTIVESYIRDPRFLDTVGDLTAEMFLFRYDTFLVLPALGELTGYDQQTIYQSFVDEPIMLVRHIVDHDLPYSEIVTAQYMLTNEVVAKMYGLEFDPAGEPWQISAWSDDRPKAGILSSAQMWRRWESDGSNFHRGRANIVSSRLLCEDFDSRDVYVPGGIDIADEFEVANAVMVEPSCVACHQSLDGLAAYFWGYKQLIHRNAVGDAINSGCEWDWSAGQVPEYGPNNMPEHFCYPLKQYVVDEEAGWERWALRPPSFYGVPAEDMQEVGELISGDPRFSSCIPRQVFAYFNQVDVMDVPSADTVSLQATFETSNFNFREVAKAVVLSDAFRAIGPAVAEADDGVGGLRSMRPEQLGDLVEDLTGYRWKANTDLPVVEGTRAPFAKCADKDLKYGPECWGDVDLLENDLFGLRSMMGGTDHLNITHPTHTMTPTKALAVERLVEDAAGYAIDTDFAVANAASRRLMRITGPTDVDEAIVRDQLAYLHKRVLGVPTASDDPDVDRSYELFELALATRGGDVAAAWKVTLSVLLQDPRMMYF